MPIVLAEKLHFLIVLELYLKCVGVTGGVLLQAASKSQRLRELYVTCIERWFLHSQCRGGSCLLSKDGSGGPVKRSSLCQVLVDRSELRDSWL